MRIQSLPQKAVLYPTSDRNIDLSWRFLSTPPGSGTRPFALMGSSIAPVGVILKKEQIKPLFLSFHCKVTAGKDLCGRRQTRAAALRGSDTPYKAAGLELSRFQWLTACNSTES